MLRYVDSVRLITTSAMSRLLIVIISPQREVIKVTSGRAHNGPAGQTQSSRLLEFWLEALQKLTSILLQGSCMLKSAYPERANFDFDLVLFIRTDSNKPLRPTGAMSANVQEMIYGRLGKTGLKVNCALA